MRRYIVEPGMVKVLRDIHRRAEEKMNSLVKIVVGAALSASAGFSTPASAANGQNAAFFGGLAIGALAGAAIAGGAAAPVYAPGPPVYYERHCWYQTQPLFDAAGNQVSSQSVRRCN
jgi:hypothetical protein